MTNLAFVRGFMFSVLLIGFIGSDVLRAEEVSVNHANNSNLASSDAGSSVESRPRGRYIPKVSDAPLVRVGGGVRGGTQEDIGLEVIAPNHLSVTASSQPILFWHQSFDGKEKVLQVTVIRPRKAKPLIKIARYDTGAGLNSINLANHGVLLEPNVDYQWIVSLVSDKKGRWKDVLAGAMIRYEVPDKVTAELISENASLETVFTLLENGLWYDGWAGLMALENNSSSEAALHQIRQDLIAQIRLDIDLGDVGSK